MIFEVLIGVLEVLVLFIVPGFFATLAFFPSKKEIDFIERFFFSIVFGITILPFMLFVEANFLQIPINFFSNSLNVIAVVFLSALVYCIRIQAIKVHEIFYKIFLKIEKEDAVFFPKKPHRK